MKKNKNSKEFHQNGIKEPGKKIICFSFFQFFNSSVRAKRGFTLIETIVATTILVVGIVGVLSLSSSAMKFSSIFKNKLIATNLAAEGIELVYQIRNQNWLDDIDWRTYLASGAYEFDAAQALARVGLPLYSDKSLKLDLAGFYNYTTGNDTIFKRKIEIFDGADVTNPPDGIADEIKVVSTVSWTDRGAVKTVSLEDRLWNWK